MQAVSPTPVTAATVMTSPIAPLNEEAGNAISKCEPWVRGCPYRSLAEGIDMSKDNPGLRQHAEEFVQCFQSRFWQVGSDHRPLNDRRLQALRLTPPTTIPVIRGVSVDIIPVTRSIKIDGILVLQGQYIHLTTNASVTPSDDGADSVSYCLAYMEMVEDHIAAKESEPEAVERQG